jgi:hypothetical protein
MQPLRPHLGDARQILLSPDGMLNLLPFGVLVDEQGRYLAEHFHLTYLTSGRNLLRIPSTAPSQQAPIVIADPDFGLLDETAAVPASENRRSTDWAAGAMKFNPLPGTAAEAQALKAILKLKDQQVLTKGKATEMALKQVRGHASCTLPPTASSSKTSPSTSNPKQVSCRSKIDCRPLKARTHCCARAWRSPGPTGCAQEKTMACSPPWKWPGLILPVRS